MQSKEIKVAIRAAKEAGKIAMKCFGRISPRIKSDKSLVTEADVEAERKIRSILEKSFPNYSILGEEFGKKEKTSDYLWVIDPIDGTTNFSMNIPLFCISIALTYKLEPTLAVIYIPFTKELFYAIKGKGAYLNGKKIMVSNRTDIRKSFLIFCHGYDKESVRKVINFFSKVKMINEKLRQLGSAGIEFSFVASGKADAFFVPGLKPWDLAAGSLIVEEAGGKVTDLDGNRFNLYTKDILASNGKIHEKLLKLIKNS